MRRYECIVFDADHTLIEFDEDERRAFRAAFASAGVGAAEETIEDCWRFSARNWEELGLSAVHTPRIQASYHALYDTHVRAIVQYMATMHGLAGHAEEAGRVFVETLSLPSHPVPGAEELLVALSGTYRLFVATNGLSRLQRGRLSLLAPRFEELYISEEIGAIKPSAAFFRCMLSRIGADPARCLMVGDSLGSDVAGAGKAGMDCIWFDRSGRDVPAGAPAFAARITALPQLQAVLRQLERGGA